MILYLDTSALLKLYLAETGSQMVREAVRNATACCTHLVAHVEMQAALARTVRTGRLTEADFSTQQANFETDWAALHVIAVDENLVRRAGAHARRYGLRGYDSVHLAAAERLSVMLATPAFEFACFDAQLSEAAGRLGFRLLGT